MTEQQEAEIMHFFGRHVVALGGTYVALDKDGNPTGPERFYNYTACILSVKGEWWLVTAGHVFDDLERMISRRQVEVREQLLIDYIGVEAENPHPIPFDFLSMRKVWKYDRGLDFAVIPITPHYQRLLDGGHIMPLDESSWLIPSALKDYHFRIYGFPEYLIKENRLAADQPLVGYIKPRFPSVEGLPFDESEEFPRFKGKVQKKLQDAKGLSGGPIFLFGAYGGDRLYFLVAIQSSWHAPSHTVYGCPVPIFVPIAEDLLAKKGPS